MMERLLTCPDSVWDFLAIFVYYLGIVIFHFVYRELEFPLRVSIANEHEISTSRVFQGCVLEIFGVSFPIDLIHIPMRDA